MEAKLIGKDENTRRFSGGTCLKSAGCFFVSRRFFLREDCGIIIAGQAKPKISDA
ncbi:hypothetical protein CLOLEP_01138 [[Clostridium] leptum DSM 753]|uniref:Uncharacterized protein n=1 Tax=[Clostridium] leptum DSM 753 TaxID=428125 RepID=A7VRF5_9FIRM|nr:hypothetical protein CLOLEP_01138 [[Clostridium] leptum DSM 753]